MSYCKKCGKYQEEEKTICDSCYDKEQQELLEIKQKKKADLLTGISVLFFMLPLVIIFLTPLLFPQLSFIPDELLLVLYFAPILIAFVLLIKVRMDYEDHKWSRNLLFVFHIAIIIGLIYGFLAFEAFKLLVESCRCPGYGFF